MATFIVINEPLEFRSEMIYGPFKSDKLHPQYARLVGCSDISVSVSIKWTCDSTNETKGVKEVVSFPKDYWRSEKVAVQARYFFILVRKNIPEEISKNLYFEIYSPPFGDEPYKDNQVEDKLAAASSDNKVSDGRRGSSPFLPKRVLEKAFKDKSHSSGKHDHSLTDFRLPQFIPKDVLLLGGKNGSVQSLPVGQPGEYLMVDSDGSVSWMLPYNFEKKILK